MLDYKQIKINKILLPLLFSIFIFYSIKNQLIVNCVLIKASYEARLINTSTPIYSFSCLSMYNAQNVINKIVLSESIIFSKSDLLLCTPGLQNKEHLKLLPKTSFLRHLHVFFYNQELNLILKENGLNNYILFCIVKLFFN